MSEWWRKEAKWYAKFLGRFILRKLIKSKTRVSDLLWASQIFPVSLVARLYISRVTPFIFLFFQRGRGRRRFKLSHTHFISPVLHNILLQLLFIGNIHQAWQVKSFQSESSHFISPRSSISNFFSSSTSLKLSSPFSFVLFSHLDRERRRKERT